MQNRPLTEASPLRLNKLQVALARVKLAVAEAELVALFVTLLLAPAALVVGDKFFLKNVHGNSQIENGHTAAVD